MTATTRFGLAFALASIPVLGAASLHLLTQANEFSNLFDHALKTMSHSRENVFLKICQTKNLTVALCDRTLTFPKSSQRKWFQRKVTCNNVFSISGMPYKVEVLTNHTQTDEKICDRASEALYSDFMKACLANETKKIPKTLSFRNAQIASPLKPLIAFDDEPHFDNLHSTGTKLEIDRLSPKTKLNLQKGFTVLSHANTKGQRHYKVHPHSFFLD